MYIRCRTRATQTSTDDDFCRKNKNQSTNKKSIIEKAVSNYDDGNGSLVCHAATAKKKWKINLFQYDEKQNQVDDEQIIDRKWTWEWARWMLLIVNNFMSLTLNKKSFEILKFLQSLICSISIFIFNNCENIWTLHPTSTSWVTLNPWAFLVAFGSISKKRKIREILISVLQWIHSSISFVEVAFVVQRKMERISLQGKCCQKLWSVKFENFRILVSKLMLIKTLEISEIKLRSFFWLPLRRTKSSSKKIHVHIFHRMSSQLF